MRFHFGSIPETPDFVPDSAWTPLREPAPWMMQFLALPIGIGAAAVVGILWFTITPLQMPSGGMSILAFLLSFAGIVVVHELIHAFVHPMAGRSPQSILGFWPSQLLFYATYTGTMTRNRFVVVLLMPLVVISLLPLIAIAVARVDSGWAAYVSSFNTLLACGDILGAGMVLWQIPATAVVRNQGWRTYWREQSRDAKPVVEARPNLP